MGRPTEQSHQNVLYSWTCTQNVLHTKQTKGPPIHYLFGTHENEIMKLIKPMVKGN